MAAYQQSYTVPQHHHSPATQSQARRATGSVGFTVAASCSPSKLAVNLWLSRLLATDHLVGSPRWVLALESEALTTLKSFTSSPLPGETDTSPLGTGVLPKTFVVPNPDTEVCQAVTAAGGIALPVTSHALLDELESKKGTLYSELVAKGWPGYFHCIWLDYCGTLDSKAGKLRKDDIKKVLRGGLLEVHGGLLAVTISERGGAQPYKHAAVDELVEHVSTEALTHSSSSTTSLHSEGVVCYTSVDMRIGRTPLSLCTAVWRKTTTHNSKFCSADDEKEVSSSLLISSTAPRSPIPLPEESKHLTFHPTWVLYGNVDTSPLPLLKAMQLCAARFASCVSEYVTGSSDDERNRGGLVIVLDSKLAPATRALITATTKDRSGMNQIISTVELPSDLPAARAAVDALGALLRDGGTSTTVSSMTTTNPTQQVSWSPAGLHQLLKTAASDSSAFAEIDEEGCYGKKRGREQECVVSQSTQALPLCRGVWLDFERHRAFTAAELVESGRSHTEVAEGKERWKDLDRLFDGGFLCARSSSPTQILAINLKVTDAKEVWHGAYVDWILSGVTTAAARKIRADQISGQREGSVDRVIPCVKVLNVATFTVPPCTRISIIMKLGGGVRRGAVSEKEVGSEAPSWSPPSPHSSWVALNSWDVNRVKIPTTAAAKFQMITAHLKAVTSRFGLRSVILEEPGFHWVLPSLLELKYDHPMTMPTTSLPATSTTVLSPPSTEQTHSQGRRRGLEAVFCTIYEESDTVQRDEILRRNGTVDSRIRWMEPSAIIGNANNNMNTNNLNQHHPLSTSCDGLYLLTNVGGVAWRKRWLDAVEGWLQGRRGMEGAGWSVLAVLVVDHDAKDDSTNQLFLALRDVVHRAKGYTDNAPVSSSPSHLDDADVQVHPVFSLSTNHQYWCFRVWSGGDNGGAQSSSIIADAGDSFMTNQSSPLQSERPTPPEWPVMNYASTGHKGSGTATKNTSECPLCR